MYPLRVGQFLHHFPDPGGTTNAVRGLSTALLRLGWEVVVYCCSGETGLLEYQEKSGLRVARYRKPRRGRPFDVDESLVTRISTNRDQIAALVINGMFKPLNTVVARAARRANLPYIMWPHDPYHPDLLCNGFLRRLYGPVFERRTLNGAAAIHVLAEEHKQLLREYGVRTPSFAIPDGFEPHEVVHSTAESPEQSAAGEGPHFLYLGRLDGYNKGLDLLLRALSLGLREKRVPVTARVNLVGADRGSRRGLESLCSQLGISANVKFHGYVADRSPWRIIAAYDVLVLPSRWDGFALAVLEAMVVGKPVVVSDQAGIASYVEKARCGWVVPPDPRSICEGLVSAVHDREQWRVLGERGRQFAYANLTWNRVARQASEQYRQIIEREGLHAQPDSIHYASIG